MKSASRSPFAPLKLRLTARLKVATATFEVVYLNSGSRVNRPTSVTLLIIHTSYLTAR